MTRASRSSSILFRCDPSLLRFGAPLSSAHHPQRKQQQQKGDHREQAEKQQKARTNARARARRTVGDAKLAIHVKGQIEPRTSVRELANYIRIAQRENT